MRVLALAAAALAAAGCSGPQEPAPEGPGAPAPASAPAVPWIWNFDSAPVGGPPVGFLFGLTGQGTPGKWVVRADPAAPSGKRVLAQEDADPTDFRFPVAVADVPELRDLRLSVRCRMVSGEVDQAAGLVWRWSDERNYYVTRANALEGNIRIYSVQDGRRKQFGSWSGTVTAGEWHDYMVVAHGDRFEVLWDGAKVLDERDGTFPEAGRVGVWTKADSVTQFDDLVVDDL